MTFKRLTKMNDSGTLGLFITTDEARQLNIKPGDQLWVDLKRIIDDTNTIAESHLLKTPKKQQERGGRVT